MACFIMDILMLTAEAFSYPGGHGWMGQAAWIAPSLTRRQPCTILGYSLVTNTLLDYEDTLVLLYPAIANSPHLHSHLGVGFSSKAILGPIY